MTNIHSEKLSDAMSTFASVLVEMLQQRMTEGDAKHRQYPTSFHGVLTKEELAAFFRVTPRTIENWTSRGVLPYYKVGKIVRFHMADVQRAMNSGFRVNRRGWDLPI